MIIITCYAQLVMTNRPTNNYRDWCQSVLHLSSQITYVPLGKYLFLWTLLLEMACWLVVALLSTAKRCVLCCRWRIAKSGIQWIPASCTFLGWVSSTKGHFGCSKNLFHQFMKYCYISCLVILDVMLFRSSVLYLGVVSTVCCWIGIKVGVTMSVGMLMMRKYMDQLQKLPQFLLDVKKNSCWRENQTKNFEVPSTCYLVHY